jgi:Holliday junction resolvasome RuvABC endonuclease subunit
VWDGRRLLRSRRLVTLPSSSGKAQGLLDPRRFRGTDEERIEWLRRNVVRNIRKFQPALVIIEGHAFGARGRGLTILHELHGVIKNELHRAGIPFSAESPTTIKLLFAGKGGASKDEMIAAAKTLCGKDLSDDEADALGCAWFGHANYKTVTDKLKSGVCDSYLYEVQGNQTTRSVP